MEFVDDVMMNTLYACWSHCCLFRPVSDMGHIWKVMSTKKKKKLDLSRKLEFWSVLCNIIGVPLSMILMRTTDKLQILTTHENQTSIPPGIESGSARTHTPGHTHTHPHTRKPIKIHISKSYSQAQRRVEYVEWNVITYDTGLNDYTFSC